MLRRNYIGSIWYIKKHFYKFSWDYIGSIWQLKRHFYMLGWDNTGSIWQLKKNFYMLSLGNTGSIWQLKTNFYMFSWDNTGSIWQLKKHFQIVNHGIILKDQFDNQKALLSWDQIVNIRQFLARCTPARSCSVILSVHVPYTICRD